jgi:hypothetical protein
VREKKLYAALYQALVSCDGAVPVEAGRSGAFVSLAQGVGGGVGGGGGRTMRLLPTSFVDLERCEDRLPKNLDIRDVLLAGVGATAPAKGAGVPATDPPLVCGSELGSADSGVCRSSASGGALGLQWRGWG